MINLCIVYNTMEVDIITQSMYQNSAGQQRHVMNQNNNANASRLSRQQLWDRSISAEGKTWVM